MPDDLTKVTDDLWAVWKYDQFPYHLCAKVEAIDADGYVRAEGYRGYRFKPITLLHGKKGERFKAYLAAARSVRRDMEEGVHNSTTDALRTHMTDFGVPCGNVPMPQGFMWRVFGKAFKEQIDAILNERAPAFLFEGEVEHIKSDRVDDLEPEPSERKLTARLGAILKRIGL